MPPVQVYLVEDSPAISERLVALLESMAGVEVVGQAEGDTQAMVEIPQLRPGFVILDLQLVSGNGLNVLKFLKKLQPTPRIMVLTNHAFLQYRLKCFRAGADYFFDKSKDLDKVVEEIQNWTASVRGPTD